MKPPPDVGVTQPEQGWAACRPTTRPPLTRSSFSRGAGSRSPVELKSRTRTSGTSGPLRGEGETGIAAPPIHLSRRNLPPSTGWPAPLGPGHGPCPSARTHLLWRRCSAWRNQRTQACTLLEVCAPSRYQVRGPRLSICVRPGHSVSWSPGGQARPLFRLSHLLQLAHDPPHSTHPTPV